MYVIKFECNGLSVYSIEICFILLDRLYLSQFEFYICVS